MKTIAIVSLIMAFAVLGCSCAQKVEPKFQGYGYIDKTGQMVIEPQFYGAYPFYEGLAAVVLDEDGAVAYIDRTGELVWSSE